MFRRLRFVGLTIASVIALFLFAVQPVKAASDIAISDINVDIYVVRNAIISWSTDTLTTGKLEYGIASGAYTNSVTTDSDTSHQVTISGLNASTKYYFKITVENVEGNTGVSPEQTFMTTTDDLDLLESKIVIRGADKAVLWTKSNKFVISSVAYGSSPDALTQTSLQDFYGTSCSGSTENYNYLKNLKPKTTYYYKITLTQMNGRCGGEKTKAFPIKQVKTTDVPIMTKLSASSARVGTTITITGKNFDQGISPGHNPIDAVVSFGCSLKNWLRRGVRVSAPCAGRILSWSDTKIKVKILGTAVTGPVYIGKAFKGDMLTNQTYPKTFVLKGPGLKIIK